MKNIQSGEIVTWRVRRAFATRQALQDALHAVGVKITVRAVTPKTYFKRAIKDCIADGTIRAIGEDDQLVSYAVVDEETDIRSESWSGRMRAAVTLDKTTGEVRFTRDTALANEIKSACTKHEGGVTSIELSAALCNAVTSYCQGVALRDGGGAYFVPVQCVDKLAEIEKVFNAATTRKRAVCIKRFAVARSERTDADVANALGDHIRDSLETIRLQCEEALQDERTRPSKLKHRQRRIGVLVNTITEYEQALGQQLDALRTSAKKTRAHVAQCLLQVESGRIEKARKRKQNA